MKKKVWRGRNNWNNLLECFHPTATQPAGPPPPPLLPTERQTDGHFRDSRAAATFPQILSNHLRSDFHWEDKEMMMPQALILSWKPMSWIQNSQTTLCVKLGNLTLSWKEGEFCRYFSILDNWGRSGTPGVGEWKQQCRLQRCSLKSRWWMILCEYFRRICVGKCKWWPMRQILSAKAFSGWKGWTKANRFFKKRENVEKYFLVKLHGNRFICLTRLVGWWRDSLGVDQS